MRVEELMRKIGKEPLPRVLLFGPGKAAFGKEPFEPLLAEKAVDKIIAANVDPSMRDLAYTAFHAEEVSPGEVALEANTLPFLVEQRVVLVRNAERYYTMAAEKKSPLNPLLEYLESPNPSTLLLMVANKSDSRKRFHKLCADLGALVECPQLEDAALMDWILREAEQRGKKLNRAAAREMIQRAGYRLGDVNNALAIVCTYVGSRQDITDEDVRIACADVAEDTVWSLTDAIAASDTAQAISTLHQLLALGKAPDEILGLINMLLVNAYKASPESGNHAMSSFVAKKALPLAQNLGFAKLKEALMACTETQFMVRSTGVDEMLALELLVVKLAAPRSRAAR